MQQIILNLFSFALKVRRSFNQNRLKLREKWLFRKKQELLRLSTKATKSSQVQKTTCTLQYHQVCRNFTLQCIELAKFLSVLALVQFLGFFPFSGVLQKKIDSVHFKWLSFRVLHSVIWLISGIFFAYLEFRNVSRFSGLNPKNIS